MKMGTMCSHQVRRTGEGGVLGGREQRLKQGKSCFLFCLVFKGAFAKFSSAFLLKLQILHPSTRFRRSPLSQGTSPRKVFKICI